MTITYPFFIVPIMCIDAPDIAGACIGIVNFCQTAVYNPGLVIL